MSRSRSAWRTFLVWCFPGIAVLFLLGVYLFVPHAGVGETLLHMFVGGLLGLLGGGGAFLMDWGPDINAWRSKSASGRSLQGLKAWLTCAIGVFAGAYIGLAGPIEMEGWPTFWPFTKNPPGFWVVAGGVLFGAPTVVSLLFSLYDDDERESELGEARQPES